MTEDHYCVHTGDRPADPEYEVTDENTVVVPISPEVYQRLAAKWPRRKIRLLSLSATNVRMTFERPAF